MTPTQIAKRIESMNKKQIRLNRNRLGDYNRCIVQIALNEQKSDLEAKTGKIATWNDTTYSLSEKPVVNDVTTNPCYTAEQYADWRHTVAESQREQWGPYYDF
jgi:hypothetical protein